MVMFHSRFSRRPTVPPPNRALIWLRDNCLLQRPVDGALVRTLLAYGEKDLAVELVGRLLSVQHDDGRFDAPNESKDTAIGTGAAAVGYENIECDA